MLEWGANGVNGANPTAPTRRVLALFEADRAFDRSHARLIPREAFCKWQTENGALQKRLHELVAATIICGNTQFANKYSASVV